MEQIITQRLVEMTFAPLDDVAGWLTRLGMEVRSQEEGVVTVRNPHLDITTAILANSDPVTRAVCLGFATFGVNWPFLCPRLLYKVNQEWRLRQRQAASAGQEHQDAPVGPRPGQENNKSHPAQKPPPATAPTFADLYENEPSAGR